MSLADDMWRCNEDKTDWYNYAKELEGKLKLAEALANNCSVENIVLRKRVFQLENRCETCTQVDGG